MYNDWEVYNPLNLERERENLLFACTVSVLKLKISENLLNCSRVLQARYRFYPGALDTLCKVYMLSSVPQKIFLAIFYLFSYFEHPRANLLLIQSFLNHLFVPFIFITPSIKLEKLFPLLEFWVGINHDGW